MRRWSGAIDRAFDRLAGADQHPHPALRGLDETDRLPGMARALTRPVERRTWRRRKPSGLGFFLERP